MRSLYILIAGAAFVAACVQSTPAADDHQSQGVDGQTDADGGTDADSAIAFDPVSLPVFVDGGTCLAPDAGADPCTIPCGEDCSRSARKNMVNMVAVCRDAISARDRAAFHCGEGFDTRFDAAGCATTLVGPPGSEGFLRCIREQFQDTTFSCLAGSSAYTVVIDSSACTIH
jgi:hypothetical protein